MKVKCIRLLDFDGREVDCSPWLILDRIYHVMEFYVGSDGERRFNIISRHFEGEWPQMGYQHAECFEIVSDKIPSNWIEWQNSKVYGMGPAAWQASGFMDALCDHDPATYFIYERERDIIFNEDQ